MSREVTIKVRVTKEENDSLAARAKERGVSISGYLRSLAFPTQGVTTADQLPVPQRTQRAGLRADGKPLCRSCAKGGVAAWNCRECSPAVAGPPAA